MIDQLFEVASMLADKSPAFVYLIATLHLWREWKADREKHEKKVDQYTETLIAMVKRDQEVFSNFAYQLASLKESLDDKDRAG